MHVRPNVTDKCIIHTRPGETWPPANMLTHRSQAHRRAPEIPPEYLACKTTLYHAQRGRRKHRERTCAGQDNARKLATSTHQLRESPTMAHRTTASPTRVPIANHACDSLLKMPTAEAAEIPKKGAEPYGRLSTRSPKTCKGHVTADSLHQQPLLKELPAGLFLRHRSSRTNSSPSLYKALPPLPLPTVIGTASDGRRKRKAYVTRKSIPYLANPISLRHSNKILSKQGLSSPHMTYRESQSAP